MRTAAQALLVALLMVAFDGPVLAQDRTTNCRPLAERGRVWGECCNQSFARNPRRGMTRQARLRLIDRCVRTRLRPI